MITMALEKVDYLKTMSNYIRKEFHNIPNRKHKHLEHKTRSLNLQNKSNIIDLKHIENDINSLKKKTRSSKHTCNRPDEEIDTAVSREKRREMQVPDEVISKLEKHADELGAEIWNFKNQNQVLRREILCARKVMKREVGGNSVSFETLRQETRETDWMGRKETILTLKDKIQELKNTIAVLEKQQTSGRRSSLPVVMRQRSKRSSSVDNISNERRTYWRLELERRLMIDKADQDVAYMESEREELEKRLKAKNMENAAMIGDVRTLREEICILVDKNNNDSEVIFTLQSIESDLKDSLDKRWELIHKIENMKQSNSRHAKMIETLREQIELHEKCVHENRLLISTLDDQKYRLKEILELEKMKNHQESQQFKRELHDVIQEFSENTKPLAELETAMTKEREKIIELMPLSLKDELWPPAEAEKEIVVDGESENINTQGSEVTEGFEIEADSLAETNVNRESNDLSEECARYQTLYEAAAMETRRMTELVFVVIETLQERTQQLAYEKRNLFEMELDKKLLQSGISSFRRTTKTKKSKQRREDESMKEELLNVKLNVLNEERAFLLEVLNTVLANQENDFELCKAFTGNNKDIFENTLNDISGEPGETVIEVA